VTSTAGLEPLHAALQSGTKVKNASKQQTKSVDQSHGKFIWVADRVRLVYRCCMAAVEKQLQLADVESWQSMGAICRGETTLIALTASNCCQHFDGIRSTVLTQCSAFCACRWCGCRCSCWWCVLATRSWTACKT
jgi:hypothetical protein